MNKAEGEGAIPSQAHKGMDDSSPKMLTFAKRDDKEYHTDIIILAWAHWLEIFRGTNQKIFSRNLYVRLSLCLSPRLQWRCWHK